MPRTSRLIVAVFAACLGFIVSLDAEAQTGRKIRVDIGDILPFTGGAWGDSDEAVDLTGDQQARVTMPFELNFGDGPKKYDIGFAENGFLSVVLQGQPLPSGVGPSGDFIALRAADLAKSPGFSVTEYGIGIVDTIPAAIPADDGSLYSYDDAVPAIRFSWKGMCLVVAGDCSAETTTFQAVFLDRSNGTGNGDFDLELNYNEEVELYGQRGLTLGANVVPLATGEFVGGQPDYYFRNGSLVPEPGSATLMALGLAGLAAWSQRRRMPARTGRVLTTP